MCGVRIQKEFPFAKDQSILKIAIAFGMIDTEMNAEFDEEDLAMIKDEIPADYIASPKEAAQMVYHVAEAPGYMTGQIVTFSGGWY